MDNSVKKVIKKTTSTQFEMLVKQLEAHPDLARGAPTYGADRASVDELWKKIAVKVNSYGPPQRSAAEWKKIWADLKSRTKKKIAENNSSLQATGGGPFQSSPLSEIEQVIDSILLMSKAAAPSGKILGFRTIPTTAEPTKAPTTQLVSQPTTQPAAQQIQQNELQQTATPARQSQTDILLTPTRQTTQIGVVSPTMVTPINVTQTPRITRQLSKSPRRQRNFQQTIGESAREQAKSAKIQAASSKEIATAANSIAESMAKLVQILERQTQALEEFINIMKNT